MFQAAGTGLVPKLAAACVAARPARAPPEAAARCGHDLPGVSGEYPGTIVPSGAMGRTASAGNAP